MSKKKKKTHKKAFASYLPQGSHFKFSLQSEKKKKKYNLINFQWSVGRPEACRIMSQDTYVTMVLRVGNKTLHPLGVRSVLEMKSEESGPNHQKGSFHET